MKDSRFSLLASIALPLIVAACANPGAPNLDDEASSETSSNLDDGAPSREASTAPEVSASAPREVLDVSKGACAATHPLVGRDLRLTSRAHGVSGNVRIIDDCTIAITEFAYDGAGRRVELYGSIGGSFTRGVSLSSDLLRPSKPYSNALLFVRLPSSVRLGDLDGLSVWCADVDVSFADVALR